MLNISVKFQFLANFDTHQNKDDVIERHYRFGPHFSCRRILILPQSNSVQNLSRLNLKTKELRGVGGTPPRYYINRVKPKKKLTMFLS